ncbi:bifunctional phosphoribosyl-AMP cyclohydrolase/phosphoribosyl-ATP diphosphatase HisIE [Flavobacterium sp. NRK F10]|uniref:bifunctional phosphoribosyl-AMP cyclohydrolase/phosphoribosyl-ATP diphosphatase HisIE n=1 Tax=Flavobacterium sp. NRK F10 TaxID=2954931 RepID=UPI00209127AB|nr:bifunctional phosphoribosyl-AMP cyclohydrolase/phosphoribosyl-ATP diphosphatase HisIE [Flavobacterium sp. NRK F10]MCO6176300.1 bifunctional phosphoribosyl-AMP cyclohydrolase/phosphoribosyl-ATP diphosphatase HisIE [Flavobacterium sp. NRK F10]
MKPNFSKNSDGLLPAVIQDAETKNVLMLGYMNEEALAQTLATQKVTFFSRSKNRLWTKGEESGNFLQLISIAEDCDQDTLLVQVKSLGPTCHTGLDTCWQQANNQEYGFLTHLEETITNRKELAEKNTENISYVTSLFRKGINKIAQKVGEEAVEVVIEAKDSNDDLFLNESADLLFHYLILLQAKNYKLNDVVNVLKEREK